MAVHRTFQSHQDDESLNAKAIEQIESSERDQGAVPRQEIHVPKASIDAYVPLNFIPEEVYLLISLWESSTKTGSTNPKPMDLNLPSVPGMNSDVESAACVQSMPPPKRYNRRLSRSFETALS